MNDTSGGHAPAKAPSRFGAGIDDAFILPLAFSTVALRKLFHATLSILVRILDYAFPILLQLVRFPLFTARIIGDGVSAGLKGIVRFLPVSESARQEWRQRVSRQWAWLRQKISYKAFEEAVHHAFERGMAWVFRTCRTLTPATALLIIAGAVLWLPISFLIATAIHAILLAKAASLPAWMQLLHPLATVIAKSKLLVLPVYPAAWPQAKKHSFVQAAFRFYQFAAAHYLVQKTGYRYRQTQGAAADAGHALGNAAARVGLTGLSNTLLTGFNRWAAWLGDAARTARRRTVRGLSALPLIGVVVRKYTTHYYRAHRAERQRAGRLSEKMSGFFDRWSIKFSAEYYEAKEAESKEAGARAGSPGNVRAPHGSAPPSPISRPRADA